MFHKNSLSTCSSFDRSSPVHHSGQVVVFQAVVTTAVVVALSNSEVLLLNFDSKTLTVLSQSFANLDSNRKIKTIIGFCKIAVEMQKFHGNLQIPRNCSKFCNMQNVVTFV